MSEWVSKLDSDELSFFSEDAVEKWLVQKKRQNAQIGRQLIVMVTIIMGSGTTMAVLISGIFGWNGIGIAYFVLVEIVFAFLFVIITYSSIVRFFNELKMEIKGAWVIETKCQCNRTTFDRLTEISAMKIKGDGNVILTQTGKREKCKACGGVMGVKRLWRKKIDKEIYRTELQRMKETEVLSRGSLYKGKRG